MSSNDDHQEPVPLGWDTCQECRQPIDGEYLDVLTYNPIAGITERRAWHHECWADGTATVTVTFREEAVLV